MPARHGPGSGLGFGGCKRLWVLEFRVQEVYGILEILLEKNREHETDTGIMSTSWFIGFSEEKAKGNVPSTPFLPL